MTSINQKPAQNPQRGQGAGMSLTETREGYGAAISTTFATVVMTGFLWSQIVTSLIQSGA